MQQIAQTTLFDNLKEKLSNPILYTYFFVFVSCNYQNILFLLYEPVKMSFKISQLEGEWLFWQPVLNTFLLVVFLTIINAVYEYYKQVWHRILQWCLDKTKIKEFVSLELHENLKDKYEDDKVKLTTAIERTETLEQLGRDHIGKISEFIEDKKNLLEAHKVEVNKLSDENRVYRESLAKFELPNSLKKIEVKSDVIKEVTVDSSTLTNQEHDIINRVPKEGLWLLKYISTHSSGVVRILALPEGIKVSTDKREISIQNNHRFKTNVHAAIGVLKANSWIDAETLSNEPHEIQLTITSEGYRYSDFLSIEVNDKSFALSA
jgi:hypothetical protein